jgi:sugar lactone lactonase YvrE
MLRTALVAGAAVAGTALMVTAALGHSDGRYRPLPPTAPWTTVFKAPVGLEGLTGDGRGHLYTPGRENAGSCSVYRVPVSGGPAAVVGSIAAPCGPAGLAFGRDGRLYIGDGDRVMVLRPSASAPPVATVFASGVPGANGLAFDRRGTLWVSDGGTAQGRVWRVSRSGAVEEAFRVQPMANDAQPGGVGRDPRGLPPGTITFTPNRAASNTLGSQHIVANGLAFDRDGTLFVADTARGAIWRVRLDRDGRVLSRMGCDTTFAEPDTLCLDNVLAEHPYLEGADGIALDDDGNILAAANERNAIAVVTADGGDVELFRNPVTAARLRNGGPLEFPTSPFIDGRTLCVTSSDGARRDNFPNAGGEVGPAPAAERAKVTCLDERLPERGLDLPVH